jgi:hypothetical protein
MQTMDDEKLGQLILYVSLLSERDDAFGHTKLNKILFYSDIVAYGRTGKSITGQEYQKLEHGPAPRRFLPVLKDMMAAGDCVVQDVAYFDRPQKRVIVLRDPDLRSFSGEEIATVNWVIESLRGLNATQVSQLSHEDTGWKIARIGDTIPMSSAFLSERPLTEEENDHGLRLAREINAAA